MEMKEEATDIASSRASEVITKNASHRSIASYLWGAAGLVSFGLGAIGAVLPLIPTTPFILLAAFCFARSSQKLNAWFRSTKLYKTVFESLLTRKAMTLSAKLKLLIPITVLLGISFALMSNVPIGRAVVAVIFIGHIVYFGFMVKTEKPTRTDRASSEVGLASMQRQGAIQED